MLYQTVLVIQIMIVAACLVFTVLIARTRITNVSKIMLMVVLLCLFQNVCYLQEMMATDFSGAMMANKLKYLGAAYAYTFYLIFVAKYCKKPIKQGLQVAMCLWNLFVIISVWSLERHVLYYKSVSFVETGIYPHLEKVAGPVYTINSIFVMLQMVACIFYAIHGYRTADEAKMKESCKILLVCSVVSVLSIPIWLLVGFGEVEIYFSITTTCIIIFFSTTLLQDMFDVSEVAHENLLANMKEPVIIIDSNYGYVESNRFAREVFPRLRACSAGDLMPEQDLLAYVRNGMMEKFYHKDRVYEVHVDRIFEDDIPIGFSILLTDMTEEHRQMKRIHDLMTEAKNANEAKTDFLASMSHELRTPINSIIGMNEMIIRETESDEVKKYAMDVKNAASMLLSLVNDILDSSKIASGKLNIIPVQYELRDIFVDLYNMVAVRALQKNLQLFFDIDPTLPKAYVGDDIRIRQILINLLTNAIKYTETGSVTLTVTGKEKGDGMELRFSVKDTGYGIRKEHIEQIFSRFDRVEEQRNRHIEGTGLGLNVTANLLALMDSQIQIESEVNVGSDFYFDLHQPVVDETPMGEFDVRQIKVADMEEYDASFIAPNAKILVVDDNEMNLKVFVNLLKETQVQIKEATSGMECLQAVEEEAFDMIFLDHMMPEMDGIETLQRLRKINGDPCKDVPIIMLTANAITGAREKYIQDGFTDFLAKPIFADQLEQMIRMYLPKELVEEHMTIQGDALKGNKRSRIPEIDELDIEYALALWKDEKALFLTMQDFYESLPKTKQQLDALYRELDYPGEMERYRLLLHTLKGTSAMIGALLLSKLCRLLEVAVVTNNRERIDALHPILMEEITTHRERLAIVAPQKAKGSTEDIVALLDMLCDALEREDYTTSDFVVKQLEMLEVDDALKGGMDALFEFVLNLDANRAMEQCHMMKNMLSV